MAAASSRLNSPGAPPTFAAPPPPPPPAACGRRTETGSCYALDIGGTNFRVMYCKLSGADGKVDASVIEGMAIPREVYTGTGDQLFGFLAQARGAGRGRLCCAGAEPGVQSAGRQPAAPTRAPQACNRCS